MLPDIRQYFGHGRRWYVRLGGLRHFESVRSSIGLYLGTRRLQTYCESSGDMRVLCEGDFAYYVRGQSVRTMIGRAENALVHPLHLVAMVRLRA